EMKNDDFSEVLRQYGDMAYRMASYLTKGDEPLARDLVQDAFLKIYKNWDWMQPDNFKGWMYRILHNLYMDHLRRKTREAVQSYDVPGPSDESDFKEFLPGNDPHPLDVQEQSELKVTIHRALATLPEEFRIPIMLCDLEGLSYEEIAKVASCP